MNILIDTFETLPGCKRDNIIAYKKFNTAEVEPAPLRNRPSALTTKPYIFIKLRNEITKLRNYFICYNLFTLLASL